MQPLTNEQAMAQDSPGSLFDPLSTFTGPGTDPRYLPGGQYNQAVNDYSGTSTAPTYNPQQQSFLNQLPSAVSNIHQGGLDQFTNSANTLQQNANNIFSGVRSAQNTINTGRTNNELGRMNATQDLLGYIRNGLRQGGSQLASMNATDSSATPALSEAYQRVGAQRQRGINNQAAIAGNSLDTQQSNLNQGTQDQTIQFHMVRDNVVNQIGQKVRDSLAALDQQGQGLSLPDRINVESEKQKVIDEGMGQLQQVDQWLQSQLGTLSPISQDQVQLQAHNLQQAGTQGSVPFNVSPLSQTLVQGPQIDQSPLFSARRLRQAA